MLLRRPVGKRSHSRVWRLESSVRRLPRRWPTGLFDGTDAAGGRTWVNWKSSLGPSGAFSRVGAFSDCSGHRP